MGGKGGKPSAGLTIKSKKLQKKAQMKKDVREARKRDSGRILEKLLPKEGSVFGNEFETEPVETTELNEYDVLLGRGSGIAKRPGNLHYRCVVWDFKDEYSKTSNTEKYTIALKVLRYVASKGGRVWEVLESRNVPGSNKTKPFKYISVPLAAAVDKTCQALREKKGNTTNADGSPLGYEKYCQQKKEAAEVDSPVFVHDLMPRKEDADFQSKQKKKTTTATTTTTAAAATLKNKRNAASVEPKAGPGRPKKKTKDTSAKRILFESNLHEVSGPALTQAFENAAKASQKMLESFMAYSSYTAALAPGMCFPVPTTLLQSVSSGMMYPAGVAHFQGVWEGQPHGIPATMASGKNASKPKDDNEEDEKLAAQTVLEPRTPSAPPQLNSALQGTFFGDVMDHSPALKPPSLEAVQSDFSCWAPFQPVKEQPVHLPTASKKNTDKPVLSPKTVTDDLLLDDDEDDDDKRMAPPPLLTGDSLFSNLVVEPPSLLARHSLFLENDTEAEYERFLKTKGVMSAHSTKLEDIPLVPPMVVTPDSKTTMRKRMPPQDDPLLPFMANKDGDDEHSVCLSYDSDNDNTIVGTTKKSRGVLSEEPMLSFLEGFEC